MKHSAFVPKIDESKLTNALRGFLGAVGGTTDAPVAFLMGAQLTLWAGVIGNKIYLEAGNGILRPNVWLTCFARSSMSGKSTAITTSGLPFKNIQEQLDNDYEEALRGFVFEQEMWKALDPEERDDESEPQRPTRGILLLASDFSDAGFYEMMKDNPVSGVIVAKEFADLHTKLHRKMTGQALAFLGAYDGDRMTRSTRDHGFEIIEEPTFSILGATTFASFATVFSSTEVENGYLSRIFPIVISAPTKDWMHYLRRDKSDQSYNTRMENQIRAWLDFEGDIQVRIPDDIEEFFCEWESRMRNDLALKYGERMGPSIVRMVPGALKVAMILQTLEIPDPEGIEELVLTLETIECAQMLMEDVFLPSMSYLFNNKVIVSYEELNENKILDILISSKGKADRSTLRKKSRLSSDILDKTLASMEYKGMIEKEIIHAKREQGGGNPKTVYSLCKD